MKIRKTSTSTGVGGITVFMVLAVLTVVVFTILTISTAQAEARLAQRHADMTRQYYEMDSQGVAILDAVAQLYEQGGQPGEQAVEAAVLAVAPQAVVTPTAAMGSVTSLAVSIPIDDLRSFEMSASLLTGTEGSRWDIHSWCVTPAHFDEELVGGLNIYY